MSDDDSQDGRMKTLMANWEREEDDDGEEKKKSKKKKKKKDKKEKADGDEAAADGEELVEKKDKKKKKKSKDKDKEKKEKSKSKDKEESPSSPSKKPKKKSKDKDKEKKKDKEKEKDKKSKKKKRKSTAEEAVEPEQPKAPKPVVLDSIDYVDDDGNASETSEDRKMKELLQQWDEDGDEDSDSSSSSEAADEDEEETFEARRLTKAELGLEDNALDHIVLAAPDFAEAMKEFESMTGIKPSVGGSLKGLGTRTARVGLDNQAYIEIIAPDPKHSGPIGAQLMNLEEGSLVPIHYAIRQTDLSDLANDYVPNELGYDPDRIAMFRAGPDGAPRKWEMLFMHGHFHGGVVPYFVDWGECEHPIGSIAQVGSLKSFVVTCPAGSKLHELLKGIKDVTVADGELGLEFSFGSPEGTITFAGDKPRGIKFPGYEEKKSVAPAPESDDDDEESNEGEGDDNDESSSSSSEDESDAAEVGTADAEVEAAGGAAEEEDAETRAAGEAEGEAEESEDENEVAESDASGEAENEVEEEAEVEEDGEAENEVEEEAEVEEDGEEEKEEEASEASEDIETTSQDSL